MKSSRKIPRVMFSQHPDNARVPYWHKLAFVDTHSEVKEAVHMFMDLGAEEIMWDWEGKYVDESVVEKLLGQNPELFSEKPLGKELFLTFRIPNPRIEFGYRLGRALMCIISASHYVKTLGKTTRPMFEVILPMTETAQELISIKQQFDLLSMAVDHSIGASEKKPDTIELIPLFESVESILNSRKVLEEYSKLTALDYIRPFCARSDPALNSGIVPTTIAIKWALSEYARFSRETGIATYPIIAPGSLPFRGGLTPKTVRQFMEEYAGVSTIVVQSAFRYDYSQKLVSKAVKEMLSSMSENKVHLLNPSIGSEIRRVIPWFEEPYRSTIELLAPILGQISVLIPKRRERFLHIGLTGYSRKMGNNKLPRAIGFTGACYSLGIPPELIGTGRGLKRAMLEGKIEVIEELYIQLKSSLRQAGRFLRKESIEELGLEEVLDDIRFIEEYLGEKLGPRTTSQLEHVRLSGLIVEALKTKTACHLEMEQAAKLRKAIG